MLAPDTSTQRTQAPVLLGRPGMARLAKFREAGITATQFPRGSPPTARSSAGSTDRHPTVSDPPATRRESLPARASC